MESKDVSLKTYHAHTCFCCIQTPMPLQLHTHVISYFWGEERGYRYLFTFFLSLDFFGINGWMSLGERAGHEQKSLKCQYYTHFKWSITSVQVLITLNYYHCCIYLLNRRSLQYPTLNMYANKEENFSFCLTREVCCKLANKFSSTRYINLLNYPSNKCAAW